MDGLTFMIVGQIVIVWTFIAIVMAIRHREQKRTQK